MKRKNSKKTTGKVPNMYSALFGDDYGPRQPPLKKHNILCTLMCQTEGQCNCGYLDSGGTGNGIMG